MAEPATGAVGLRRLDEAGYRLFVITLPEPERQTEAWMACLAYKVRRSILGVKVGVRRYFTLERGEDPETHAPVRYFCEWEGAREKHVNHGLAPSSGIEEFIALVKARLG